MTTYFLLVNFTDQGIRDIKDTIGRAEAFEQMAKKSGVTLRELFWTMGRYDVIAVFDAPDDVSAAALTLSASSLGSVRAEILRAFSFEDMKQI
ncbi:MAG TPA: GYD domain-containing protein, partial [Methyloceanibacter sp.]|nr:GYD domain-containing protein [Methyloceanibacter sp.]